MSISPPWGTRQNTPSPTATDRTVHRLALKTRKRGGRSKGPLARCAVAAAGCIALAMPLSPASAGFFDFLFPQPQLAAPAAPSYRRPLHFSHRQRPQFDHRRVAHFAHPSKKILATKHHKTIEAKGLLPRRVVDLMDDESLRNGDAVMTQDGLRIFVGDEGPHHSADDFAKITETEGLSRRELSAFLAVDPSSGGAATGDQGTPTEVAQAPLVTGRSVVDVEISAGVPIVDPRGNKIRYVGP
jgi:hypothetical protein